MIRHIDGPVRFVSLREFFDEAVVADGDFVAELRMRSVWVENIGFIDLIRHFSTVCTRALYPIFSGGTIPLSRISCNPRSTWNTIVISTQRFCS